MSPIHLPRTLKALRKGEVGIIDAVVSEDDPSNVIMSTEAGCLVFTDLNSDRPEVGDKSEFCILYIDQSEFTIPYIDQSQLLVLIL